MGGWGPAREGGSEVSVCEADPNDPDTDSGGDGDESDPLDPPDAGFVYLKPLGCSAALTTLAGSALLVLFSLLTL